MGDAQTGRPLAGVLPESAQSSRAGSDGRDELGRSARSRREAPGSQARDRDGLTTIRAVVEYDGSAFCGLQFQPAVRTVAGELERVLSQLLQHSVKVTAAGRTDA